MIVALDSATPPNAQQVAQAKAAGIGMWNGYAASQPNVGLYRPWSKAEFDVVRALNPQPIAYCSGRDDATAMKYLAISWNVRLCLDVESGIRDDGPWVQQWLNDSGAGLYGNKGVHAGRTAAFHIASWYVADPGRTWPSTWPKPNAPCGWQWANTHTEFGVGVDRCYFDDYFSNQTGGFLMALSDQQQAEMYNWAKTANTALFSGQDQGEYSAVQHLIDQVNVVIGKLGQGGGGLTDADRQLLTQVRDAAQAVSSHLK